MIKILITFFISAMLLSCGKTEQKTHEKKEQGKLVKLEELKEKTITNTKNYNGNISPIMEVSEITPTGGYVKKINFKNGQKVKMGDVVLVLEDPGTESAYKEAMGELSKAESEYDINKNLFKKYTSLFNKSMISIEEYSSMKSKNDNSSGNLKVAQGNLQKAKDDFDRLQIKSKIDGIVTDLDLKEHEKVQPSQKILTVIDNSKMEISISVSGKDLSKTSLGGKAFIHIDELNKDFDGIITEINQNANADNKKYSVKISVDNKDHDILKGMYAKVRIDHGDISGLFIPKKAIMVKELYSYIAVVRNGKVNIFRVETGETIDDMQNITFPQYELGDKLVIEGQYLLNNNDSIREN